MYNSYHFSGMHWVWKKGDIVGGVTPSVWQDVPTLEFCSIDVGVTSSWIPFGPCPHPPSYGRYCEKIASIIIARFPCCPTFAIPTLIPLALHRFPPWKHCSLHLLCSALSSCHFCVLATPPSLHKYEDWRSNMEIDVDVFVAAHTTPLWYWWKVVL